MSDIYAVFPESIRADAVTEIEALEKLGPVIVFREEPGQGEPSGEEDTGDTDVPDSSDTLRLTSAAALLVILGETSDYTRVKQDLNLALDRHMPVVALYFGEPELDQGLLIQLGLAERFRAGETDRERAAAALRAAIERKSETGKSPDRRHGRGRRKLVRGAAAAGVLILGVVCYVYLPKYLPAFSGAGEESLTDASGGSTEAAESTGARAADLNGELKEALFSAGVDADGDGDISEAELERVTSLTLSGMGLSDLGGLSAASSLKKLDLSDNSLTDISELAALTGLRELDLSGNSVRDISALAALTGLRSLDLRGNPVEDLRILDFLPELGNAETGE